MSRTRIACRIIYTRMASAAFDHGRFICGIWNAYPTWKLGPTDSVRLWIFYS